MNVKETKKKYNCEQSELSFQLAIYNDVIFEL